MRRLTRPLSPQNAPQRLASGDWFTARVSACGMFAVAFEKCSPSKTELRRALQTTFSELCRDETPMVR